MVIRAGRVAQHGSDAEGEHGKEPDDDGGAGHRPEGLALRERPRGIAVLVGEPVGLEDLLSDGEAGDAGRDAGDERDRRDDRGLRAEHNTAARVRGEGRPDQPRAVLGRDREVGEHGDGDLAEPDAR